MGYTFKKHEPFVITVETDTGKPKEYKIKAYEKLDVDELSILDFKADAPGQEKVEKIMKFFLQVCPELKELDAGASEWVALYKEYSKGRGE